MTFVPVSVFSISLDRRYNSCVSWWPLELDRHHVSELLEGTEILILLGDDFSNMLPYFEKSGFDSRHTYLPNFTHFSA